MATTVTPSRTRGGRLSTDGLSAQLRSGTRQEHLAAEAAFALETRLVDLGAYRLLLLTLQDFHRPLEAALMRVIGWGLLVQPIDPLAHCRADLLAQDLRRLAAAPPRTPGGRSTPASVRPLPSLSSPAQAMGVLYVLAGSALGGRVIARRARALLGPDLPVAFFDSAGRLDSQQHWRALQASLDAFGDTAGATSREQSVAAARQTFRALTGRLDARG